MAKVRLASVSDVPEGGMIAREHDGRQILLVKVGGEIFALDDECTHQGAPLHEGTLGQADGEPHWVTCPWHEAHFDVRTGEVHQETDWATDTAGYTVEIRGTDVYVDL
jgi:nitrite reductase/ring-hydroxylating ferredoxin subunit